MGEVNADSIRSVINTPDPVLEAFSMLLRSVAADACAAVSGALAYTGNDPSRLPGEFFAQAILVEADRVFVPITREKWIEVFDSYQNIKDIVNNDPRLKAEVEARRMGAQGTTITTTETSTSGLLDGDF